MKKEEKEGKKKENRQLKKGGKERGGLGLGE